MEVRKNRFVLAAMLAGFAVLFLFTGLIGNLGMAYFAIAMECCLLVYALLFAGLPCCIERFVKSRMAKEQYKNADIVLKTALFYALVTGIIGSLFLFFIAELFCGKVLQAKEAALALKIMSPLFLVNGISAVLKGYFQGIGTAMPTVVSGGLKQLLTLSFGALFGYILYGYGKKAAALLQNEHFIYMYGAAGVALGFLLAGLLTLLFLLLIYLGAGRRVRRRGKEGMRLSENGAEVFRGLMGMMLPLAGTGFLLRAGTLLGLGIYQSYPNDKTLMLASFGGFYGRYLMIVGMITVLALICCALIETTVIHSVKKEEYKNTKNFLAGGMQSIWVLTLFLGAAVCALSSCFFKETEDVVKCMRHGALFPVFLAMGIYFSHILNEIDKKKTALLSLAVSLLAFFATAFISGSILKGNILLFVYAWLVFAVVHCLVNGFFLLRATRLNPEWLRMFLLPFLAAVVTGVCMFFLSGAFLSILGGTITGILSFVVGGICYLVLLFVFRCIREKDLYFLPGGPVLQRVAKKLHFL